MRQSSSGPLTTILMLIPLVVVPLLAMFGLPSFSSSDNAATPELEIEGLLGQPSAADGANNNFQPQAVATGNQFGSNPSPYGTAQPTNNAPSQSGMQVGLNSGAMANNNGYPNPSNGNVNPNGTGTPNSNGNLIGLSANGQLPNTNSNNANPNNTGALGNGTGNAVATPGVGLAIGSNARFGDAPATQGNATDPSGQPEVSVRNPFMNNQPGANNAMANNSSAQPVAQPSSPQAMAFDPGELEENDFPSGNDDFPLTNGNPSAPLNDQNQVATAGFESRGFSVEQQNSIAQMSGQNNGTGTANHPGATNQPGASNQPGQNNGVPNGQLPMSSQGAVPGNAAASSQPANNQASMSWQSAVRLLNQWGIDNFMLQPGVEPGHFHFSCYYTPVGDSSITVQFAAENLEPLKAVEDVLQQIHKYHLQRQQAGQNSPR